MFGRIMDWLRSWIRPKTEFYTEQERYIYSYFDGHKFLTADPLVLHRCLREHWPEITSDLKAAAADMPNKFSDKAGKQVADRLRKVFGIRPLYANPYSGELMYADDPEGKGLKTLDDDSVIGVFNEFMAWTEIQKKRLNTTPTPVKETSPVIEPSSAGELPTSNSSVSTSIVNDNNPETVEPLPLVPSSPLDSSIPDCSGMRTTTMDTAKP